MKKTSVFALLLWLLTLPSSTWLLNLEYSQAQSASARQTADTQGKPAASAKAPKPAASLFYPLVRASYVGGMVFNMPLVSPLHSRVLHFLSPRQYRTRGGLTLGEKSLVFIFKQGGEDPALPAGSLFSLRSCKDAVSQAVAAEASGQKSDDTAGIEDSKLACTDPNHPKRPPSEEKWVMSIPYSQIKLLSRSKIGPGDLTAVTTVYGTTAVGLLSSVISAVGKAHAKELYGGVAAGALALGYYLVVAQPHVGEHYIAVFVCHEGDKECAQEKADAQSSATAAESLSCDDLCKKVMAEKLLDKDKSADDFFKRGDVVMFRIPNNHDYYNISMVLSGKTGQTFVEEAANKGATK